MNLTVQYRRSFRHYITFILTAFKQKKKSILDSAFLNLEELGCDTHWVKGRGVTGLHTNLRDCSLCSFYVRVRIKRTFVAVFSGFIVLDVYNLTAGVMLFIEPASYAWSAGICCQTWFFSVDTALASASPFCQLCFSVGCPLLWDLIEA